MSGTSTGSPVSSPINGRAGRVCAPLFGLFRIFAPPLPPPGPAAPNPGNIAGGRRSFRGFFPLAYRAVLFFLFSLVSNRGAPVVVLSHGRRPGFFTRAIKPLGLLFAPVNPLLPADVFRSPWAHGLPGDRNVLPISEDLYVCKKESMVKRRAGNGAQLIFSRMPHRDGVVIGRDRKSVV
jgi:hypothetical protein